MVKKLISSTLLLTAVTLFSIGNAAMAVDVTGKACEGIQSSSVCPDAAAGRTENPLFGPNGVLTSAVEILSVVLGVIAVIVLVIAGIRFATSQGDPQKVASARSTVIYALAGIVVAVLSQALVQLVLTRLPD